jgi:hypothetical protein
MLEHARFQSRTRRSWLRGLLSATIASAAAWLGGRPAPARAQGAPGATTLAPFFTTTGFPNFTTRLLTTAPPGFTTTAFPSFTTRLLTTAPAGFTTTAFPIFTTPPGLTTGFTTLDPHLTLPPSGGNGGPTGTTAVPEPGSLAVFGSGLAAGVAWVYGRGFKAGVRSLLERWVGQGDR